MNEDILGILQEIRPEADFSTSANFLDDGLLDSFDVVMLVSSLDARYGISIGGIDVVPENFKDLPSIGRLLGRYGVGG